MGCQSTDHSNSTPGANAPDTIKVDERNPSNGEMGMVLDIPIDEQEEDRYRYLAAMKVAETKEFRNIRDILMTRPHAKEEHQAIFERMAPREEEFDDLLELIHQFETLFQEVGETKATLQTTRTELAETKSKYYAALQELVEAKLVIKKQEIKGAASKAKQRQHKSKAAKQAGPEKPKRCSTGSDKSTSGDCTNKSQRPVNPEESYDYCCCFYWWL